MKKLTTIFEAPVNSNSGYGRWADAIFDCLDAYPHLDLKVAPCSWGQCNTRIIQEKGDAYRKSKFLMGQVQAPDVYITNTIPHIPKPLGRKLNINITAGLEVDRLYPHLVDGANQWDCVIVPSRFARQVFIENGVKKPVEVLPWSADTSIFKISSERNAKVDAQMATIKEQDIFLFVGQITSHSLNDRKNISALVKTFRAAFNGWKDKPALLLKTGGVNVSTFDRNSTLEYLGAIKNMIESDANIYLLHGELNDAEMNALFNHPRIVANISFTRAEGWGQPLLQASLAGKPVIAPNYSGHLDFLDEGAILLDGKLVEIPGAAVSEYFCAGSKWFEVDTEKAQTVLRDFYFVNRDKANADALKLAHRNADRFNMDKMKYRTAKLLDKYVKP